MVKVLRAEADDVIRVAGGFTRILIKEVKGSGVTLMIQEGASALTTRICGAETLSVQKGLVTIQVLAIIGGMAVLGAELPAGIAIR